MKKSFIVIVCLIACHSLDAKQPPSAHVKLAQENSTTLLVTLHIPLPEGHVLYRDSLDISVDNPNVGLSAYKTSKPSTVIFDTRFKKDKQVFSGDITFTLSAHFKKIPCQSAHMHIAYLTSVAYQIHHQIVPLQFPSAPVTNTTSIQDTQASPHSVDIPLSDTKTVPVNNTPAHTCVWDNATSQCPATSSSWLLLLLGAFLFFEGFLFLHKAKMTFSLLDIYGGMLLIVISILLWVHCYSLIVASA